jgi:hypothetical protein
MDMRNIFVIIIVLIPFLISSASAQFLGQLTPAPTLNRGDGLGGAYMGVYEDAFSVFGQFRYGVAKYVDLGLKLGMISLDPGYGESNTGLAIGGDIKYWFMERHTGDPLDVSLGVGTEYLSISDFSVFSLGTNVIASYEIEHNQGKSVTPYGRLNLRWERSSFESAWRWPWRHEGNWSHSDFDVALALGADLKISSDLSLVGELEIDDNVGFVAGINYHMF